MCRPVESTSIRCIGRVRGRNPVRLFLIAATLAVEVWSTNNAQSQTITDALPGDFVSGSGSCSTPASASAPGVILPPALLEDFTGVTLGAQWNTTTWTPSGSATVASDLINVD